MDEVAGHPVLLIVESLVEHVERALEVLEPVPDRSGWPELGANVVGEHPVEQRPLVRIKGEGIEVEDLDDGRLILLTHI